jgi:4-aminobutyrate aminotransferase-like enzyme
LEEEKLMLNAMNVGNYMMKRFNDLKQRCRNIGEVRGSGFCLGLDLVLDQESREPAGEIADRLVNKLRDSFILTETDGPFHNVLKIKPPMCFSFENADSLIRAIEEILTENL